MTKSLPLLVAALIVFAARIVPAAPQPATQPTTRPVVRVAVIGGMNETGFWDALAERFERETGISVETRASGPKDGIAPVFRQGGCDLITMHASDAIVNLVADGYAMDLQPWVRNDMVIVGPADDPAGIKGMTDAAAALEKIGAAKAPFLVHSSLGAQEVLRGLLDPTEATLPPETTTILLEDRHRRALMVAAERKAYTLVGRIPFRSGKLPSAGLEVMVSGDPRLRRPYLLALVNPATMKDARLPEARRLAEFLRSERTQSWIATFGKGKYDDQPLFFPIAPKAGGDKPSQRDPAGLGNERRAVVGTE